MGSDLALLGGRPLIDREFKPYPSIGKKEEDAVVRVIRSGQLSAFYGSDSPMFFGGREVRAFEEEWAEYFNTSYAVTVNSATSGLFSAMGAIGISAGDEVIVPPTTMSASAMAPLVYGAVPVFVDIEDETFCLDLEKVNARITKKTKAIIAVNLFGHPAKLHELRKLADEKGIFLIEDNAQGPLASEMGVYAGTVGHIGVFSLNYHKHIHTGEGGVCVTSDADLAERLQLIRNHGENLVESRNIANITNLVGFNYRMTELSAAIGRVQLQDAALHVERRERIASDLSDFASSMPGITVPKIRPECRHVYYVWALRIDEDVLGISREKFSEALTAEGFPNSIGYVKPLYFLPIFQQKNAFGRHSALNESKVDYSKGLCPVAERLWKKEFLYFEPCAYDLNGKDVQDLKNAFMKVYENRLELL